MNIEHYINNLETKFPDKGFAFLAHRVPTSIETPYRIAVSDTPIQSNTPIVLILGGSGNNIQEHNGLLKTVSNFIRTSPELDVAQVHVAIRNWGTEYNYRCDRDAFIIQKTAPTLWQIMKKHTKHPLTNMPAIKYQSKVISDIFDAVILPKISDKLGNKLPTNILLKNLRGITIVAYCAGGHIAMKLEELAQQKMKDIGYTHKEIVTALYQISVIGYAMPCPYEQSDMRFFAFASMGDIRGPETERAFPLTIHSLSQNAGCVHFTKKNSDIFYCPAIRNYKFELLSNKNTHDINRFSEHSFIGFVATQEYSIEAKQLQTIFAQIIKQNVLNSIYNSYQKYFIPLPTIMHIVKDTKLLQQMDSNYKKANLMYNCFKAPFCLGLALSRQLALFILRIRMQRNK